MKNKPKSLTIKQENFCQAYLKNGGNATQAYREAYDCKKMKEETINDTASKLLKNPEITQRLNDLKNNFQRKFEYTVEQSFRKLENIQQMALVGGGKNFNAYLKAEDLIQRITGLQKQVLVSDRDNPIGINTQIIHAFVKGEGKEGEE
jgi:phage terminase small subunit